MSETSTAVRRKWRAAPVYAVTAASALLMLGAPLAGVANAAVQSVAIASSDKAQTLHTGDTVTFNVTDTRDATDTTPIEFIITSGPDADQANNGANAADGTCDTTASTSTCSFTNNGSAGTDTVRVFADSNGNNSYDSGEPSDTATATFVGAVSSVTLTPSTGSSAQNTCFEYTVSASDAGGRTEPGGTVIDVSVLQSKPDTATLSFCDPDGTGPAVAPATDNAAATNALEGEVTTGADGTASFGIESDTTGSALVRAFYDNAPSNNSYDAGEPNDTSTHTFTAGGTEGVNSLSASPRTATNFVGEQHTITAVLLNSAGDPVAGVTPEADVTGANDTAAISCTESVDNGSSTCTYTGTTAGNDSITIWVNQAAGTTAGPDAGEPQDTVQKTYVGGVAGRSITLTCTGYTGGAPSDSCTNPTDVNAETFTATVVDPDGPDAGTDADPAAGVIVKFAVTATSAATSDDDATVSPAQCTTGADGTCTTTLTNPSPKDGDSATVTATTATDTATTSASATKTWAARVPSALTFTPSVATNQVDTSHTANAVVTDQFGDPVAGDTVDFTVTGRNSRTGSDVSDSAGKVSYTYTDTGSASSAGTDTITGTADADPSTAAFDTGGPTGQQTKRWITGSTTTAAIVVDMNGCATFGSAPNYTPSGVDSSDSDMVGDNQQVCATVRSANGDSLAGKLVTFTSSGVGYFTSDGSSTDNLGTTTTAYVDTSGHATVFIRSTKSGDQTVTASADGQSASGTESWYADYNNQNIDCSPESATVALNSDHTITCVLTDEFGNAVTDAWVGFDISGVGSFSQNDANCSGAGASCGVYTDTQGRARFIITSDTEGTTTATGHLEESWNGTFYYCDQICSDTVTTTWTSGPAPQHFVDTPQQRIFDTRNTGGRGDRSFTVTLPSNVPDSAEAVMLQVSVVNPDSNGFIRLAAPGTSPDTTALNYNAHRGQTNLAVSKFSNHQVVVYVYGGAADVVVDLAGYYTTQAPVSGESEGKYIPVSQQRLGDTRSGDTPASANGSPAEVTFTVPDSVPANADVVVNVSAVDPATSGFLRVGPTGGGVPATTAVNFTAHEGKTNLAVTKVDSSRQLTVYVFGSTDVVVDLIGYFGSNGTSAGQLQAVNPTRVYDSRTGLGTSTGLKTGAQTVDLGSSIPADATGVVLNISAAELDGVSPATNGFMRVYPYGDSEPMSTALNFTRFLGQTNLVFVQPASGKVTVNIAGTTNLVVDVVGYYTG